MNKAYLIFGAAVSLVWACTTPTKPSSYRAELDEIKEMSRRLDAIVFPLLKAGEDLCTIKKTDIGTGLHKLSDYPEYLRPVAKTYWNLGHEMRVLFVRAGSAYEKSGIVFGDKAPPILQQESEIICGYTAKLRISEEHNAFASGKDIIITTGLMRQIGDLPLSLIAAHELAHNVLGHVDEETSKANELAADRWALFLLARADLDYKKAIGNIAATAPPHSRRDAFYTWKNARRKNFYGASAEIKALQKAEKPFVP